MIRSSAPLFEVKTGTLVIDALVGSKLASSKREARQFLADQAIVFNGGFIIDEKRKLTEDDFYKGMAVLKRGKKNVCVLVLS